MQHMGVNLLDGGRILDSIDEEGVALRNVMPLEDLEKYPTLCSIDPYDTVTFNSSQMPSVINELENLLVTLEEDEGKVAVKHLLSLAVSCREESGYSLQFLGD